jgi:hypothetical protein
MQGSLPYNGTGKHSRKHKTQSKYFLLLPIKSLSICYLAIKKLKLTISLTKSITEGQDVEEFEISCGRQAWK